MNIQRGDRVRITVEGIYIGPWQNDQSMAFVELREGSGYPSAVMVFADEIELIESES